MSNSQNLFKSKKSISGADRCGANPRGANRNRGAVLTRKLTLLFCVTMTTTTTTTTSLDAGSRDTDAAHLSIDNNYPINPINHIRQKRQEGLDLVFIHTIMLREKDFLSLPRKIYKCDGAVLDKNHDKEIHIDFTIMNEKGTYPEGFVLETIDAGHAWLTATQPVDREAGWKSFEIDVMGQIKNEVVHEILRIIIEIEDDNDNPPQFDPSSLQGQLEENAPPSFILKLKASDRDEGVNAEVEFELESVVDAKGDAVEAAFKLNAQTGNLESLKTFDREESAFYNVSVKAKDKGTPPLETSAVVRVNIADLNDNPPTCASDGVHCEIPEHTSLKSPLSAVDPKCRFNCEDPDDEFGKMIFEPEAASEDCFIRVDGKGEIWLTKEMDAERLDDVAFVCKVRVVDAATPSFAVDAAAHFTVVDVNDNAPAPQRPYRLVVPFENNTEDFVHPEVIRFEDADKKSVAGEGFKIELDPASPLRDNVSVEIEPDKRSVKLRLKTPMDLGSFAVPLKACDADPAAPQCRVHVVSLAVVGPPGADAVVGGFGPVYVVVIVVVVVVLLLLILVAVCLTQIRERRRRKRLPDNEEVSEITRYFDEEGPGDEDTEAFDIKMLRKPTTPSLEAMKPTILDIPLDSYIEDRLRETNQDALAGPPDTSIPFIYEGVGSVAGSLSTIHSSSSGDFDFDELRNWGPWFTKLAGMYSGGDDEEDVGGEDRYQRRQSARV